MPAKPGRKNRFVLKYCIQVSAMSSPKIIVYTCNTNQYDLPIRGVEQIKGSELFLDECLNAKAPKVLSHLYYPDADWTIWCDSNLKLLIEPEELIKFFDYPEIGVYAHDKRASINDEIDACKAANLDSSQRLEMHRNMPGRLACCFLIIRRKCPAVAAANAAWWAEITTKSKRDQLSFPYTMGPLATYRDIPHHPTQSSNKSNLNDHFFRVPHKEKILEVVRREGKKVNLQITDKELARALNKIHKDHSFVYGGHVLPRTEGDLFDE